MHQNHNFSSLFDGLFYLVVHLKQANFIFWREPSRCVWSTIYCISAVVKQHIKISCIITVGYIWLHVSAVTVYCISAVVKQHIKISCIITVGYIWLHVSAVTVYCISTVVKQHIKISCIITVGYIWLHVSAVTVYCISAVVKQHIKIRFIITVGYIWLHVSAVTRPSSGQQGTVMLRYIRLVFPMESHCLH